jgi:hypothetical protein
MKIEGIGSPRWGPRKCQLLATLCVGSSLTLFSLGDADPTSGFCLRTLSSGRPTAIASPILDTMVISLTVEDMVCEEYEGHVNVYSALYYILQRSKVSLPHLFKNYGALRTARRL